MAIVNDDVVTLTDVRLAKAFGFYDNHKGETGELSYQDILERTIERKLIIGLARQNLTVTAEEVSAWLLATTNNMEEDAIRQQFETFDITEEELGAYGKEVLLYQKIIDQRFSLTAAASLSEIEVYYNNTYLPEQQARGEEPAPMMQILEEIEAAVKANKSQNLGVVWIQNLRRQAEIQVFTERYPEYFKLLNY
ncbi:MAG: hypothetical protein GQ544_02750 [Candidatus Aminicenantes bacterium]|nr:hypothetical protein [Candidatus Aminicenantes bacterium]